MCLIYFQRCQMRSGLPRGLIFIFRYNESGKEDELEKCKEQMNRLERKAQKYDDESKRLSEDIDAIKNDLATQKVTRTPFS